MKTSTHSSMPRHGAFGRAITTMRRISPVLMCAFLTWACESPPAMPLTAAPPPSEESYRLDAGDKVRIDIFNEKNLSGEYQIDGNGTLTLPLIGSIAAKGLTANELTSTLAHQYSEFLRAPSVSLEILTYRPFYVVGEVQKPGNYPYVNGMTVINAVAIAGGFTYRANTNSFYIQRKHTEKEMQFGAQQTTEVRPGDVIIVRERFF